MPAGSLGDMLVWKRFLVERNMSFGWEGSGFESTSAHLAGKLFKTLAFYIGIMAPNKMAGVQCPVQV